jgi:hypothetical protein
LHQFSAAADEAARGSSGSLDCMDAHHRGGSATPTAFANCARRKKTDGAAQRSGQRKHGEKVMYARASRVAHVLFTSRIAPQN